MGGHAPLYPVVRNHSSVCRGGTAASQPGTGTREAPPWLRLGQQGPGRGQKLRTSLFILSPPERWKAQGIGNRAVRMGAWAPKDSPPAAPAHRTATENARVTGPVTLGTRTAWGAILAQVSHPEVPSPLAMYPRDPRQVTPTPRLLAAVTSSLWTWGKERAMEWLGGGFKHRGWSGWAGGGLECRPAALPSVLLRGKSVAAGGLSSSPTRRGVAPAPRIPQRRRRG